MSAFEDAEVLAQRCASCSTLRIDHKSLRSRDNPWDNPNITTGFIDALNFRRSKQAQQIIERFRPILADGRVLDYSCGQGVFVEKLTVSGVDALGCDIQLPDNVDRDQYLQVETSWGMPPLDALDGVSTMTMLDVLEHIPDARGFLEAVHRDTEVQNLVIKVPLVSGPVAFVASLLTRLGRYEVMDQLLQVGDPSPHVWFFTPRGLLRLVESAGFAPAGRLNLAEIGGELPERMRGESQNGRITELPLKLVGVLLELLSYYWTDTAVFLFKRSRGSSGTL